MNVLPQKMEQDARNNQPIYETDMSLFWNPEEMENTFGIVANIALETTERVVHSGIVLGAIVYIFFTDKKKEK